MRITPSIKAKYDEAVATAHRLVSEVLQDGFAHASVVSRAEGASNFVQTEPYTLCRPGAGGGLLKLQLDSDQHLPRETLVNIDRMLEIALNNVAATHGLKLDMYTEGYGQVTLIRFVTLVVAD